VTYGDLLIDALPEGRFTVGLDKRFVPHAEGDAARPGTLFISVTPFLVRMPSETLLLDAGLGEWATGRGTEVLLGGLAARGVAPERVDRVVLSHLHFDHAGGAVASVHGEWRPTFQNAEYAVQRAELTAAGYTGESVRARDLVVDTLDRAGQLVLLDGDGPVPGSRAETTVTGGHTGAHQIVRIPSGGLTAVYGGDVMGTPGQVVRRFVAKYDADGAASQRWRETLAREAAEGGHLLLFYHSTGAPAAFVSESAKGPLVVEPVEA
jgi:glyoxylase-like metal-dependent hydrolase (beta-lactamase superfamily II)